MTPLDTIRARYQLSTKKLSVKDVIKELWSNEGYKGFYKGLINIFLMHARVHSWPKKWSIMSWYRKFFLPLEITSLMISNRIGHITVWKFTGTTRTGGYLMNSQVATSSWRSNWFSNIISRSGRPVGNVYVDLWCTTGAKRPFEEVSGQWSFLITVILLVHYSI